MVEQTICKLCEMMQVPKSKCNNITNSIQRSVVIRMRNSCPRCISRWLFCVYILFSCFMNHRVCSLARKLLLDFHPEFRCFWEMFYHFNSVDGMQSGQKDRNVSVNGKSVNSTIYFGGIWTWWRFGKPIVSVGIHWMGKTEWLAQIDI